MKAEQSWEGREREGDANSHGIGIEHHLAWAHRKGTLGRCHILQTGLEMDFLELNTENHSHHSLQCIILLCSTVAKGTDKPPQSGMSQGLSPARGSPPAPLPLGKAPQAGMFLVLSDVASLFI